MKVLLSAILTALVFMAFHFLSSKTTKRIIFGAYASGIIILSVVYNVRTIKRIIPFFRPVKQTIYQIDFLSEGEYADAFLNELLSGKTAYTPNDAHNTVDEDPGLLRLSSYYHAYNMWNYLESNDVLIIKDSSLNDFTLTNKQKAQFKDLGLANDLMRYTFPYTKYSGKLGNGFFYYWYYCVYINNSHIYLCEENLKDANELIVLWELSEDEVTENYYIISKDQFKSLSALPQQRLDDE